VVISAPGAGGAGAGDGGTLATRGGSVRGGATGTSRGALVGGAARATVGAAVGVALGGTGVVVGVGRGGDGRAGRVVVGRGKVVGGCTGRVVVGRAGTVVGGGSGAVVGGGGGSVVGGGGGRVVGGAGGSVGGGAGGSVGGGGGSVGGGGGSVGGGGGSVGGGGGVRVVVGLAAASTVGRTSISHSRAVADPRLPSARARARNLPRCVGARRRVSPSPAGTPSTVQDVRTVSPPAAGRARRTRSTPSSCATSRVVAAGLATSTRGGRGGSTRTAHQRSAAPAGPSSRSVTRCAPMCAGVGTKSHVSAIPGIVWPSSRQEQRASPPTAGAAKRWRSPTRSRTLRARGLALASGGASACTGAGRPAMATRAASSSDVRGTRRVGVPTSLRRRSPTAPHGRVHAVSCPADAQGEISCGRPRCRL